MNGVMKVAKAVGVGATVAGLVLVALIILAGLIKVLLWVVSSL